MKTIKGPAIFLAQLAGDESPFDSLEAIAELSTHLQGQLVAVHSAYDEMFDGFAEF